MPSIILTLAASSPLLFSDETMIQSLYYAEDREGSIAHSFVNAEYIRGKQNTIQ